MAADKAKELGPQAARPDQGYAAGGGVDPAYMGLGPIPAARKLLGRLGLIPGHRPLIELNEALAVKASPACGSWAIGLDEIQPERAAAISISHPVGCTGARITYSLAAQAFKNGISTSGSPALCIGGGRGMAILLERV